MHTIATVKFCIMQTIDIPELAVSRYAAMDYGDRFRQLRKSRFKGTVLELARRIGKGYTSTVYNIESDWRVPTLPTLARHAAALECEPWELLEGVDAEVDRVRALASLSSAEAKRQWQHLLKLYEKSTVRGRRKESGADVERAAERQVGRLLDSKGNKRRLR